MSRGVFVGTISVLVALLLITSSLAVLYYGQAQSLASENQRYVGELDTSLSSYRSLVASYDQSLKDYNSTLSLLSDAVANLNTSTLAYKNASLALPSLWGDFQNLAALGGRQVASYSVSMLVVYGNGTRQWYNDSSALPGWNGYLVTLVLLNGNVQATWYPTYGEHLVSGINGVPSDASTSWFVWEFEGGNWSVAPTGVDLIRIHNDSVIAWTLCGYDANFNPSCHP